MPFIIHGGRKPAAFGALIALGLIAAAPAQASRPLASPDRCQPEAAVERPFAPWGDTDLYNLLPGGDLESPLEGWTLAGGAAVVAGNDPLPIGAPTDALILDVPAGGSVLTAPVCIDKTYPWIRLIARSTSGRRPRLQMDTVYQDARGRTVDRKSDVQDRALPLWGPSGKLAIRVKLDRDAAAPVQFRFTALAGSSWQLDDIHVDPRGRG